MSGRRDAFPQAPAERVRVEIAADQNQPARWGSARLAYIQGESGADEMKQIMPIRPGEVQESLGSEEAGRAAGRQEILEALQ